ncbi:hypothetical protein PAPPERLAPAPP_04070 [Brevundimonas phage vB_BpoS-Papperlapapp]|nr:hypothetical protein PAPPERLAPAPP_04070 [Brevundimonas phage vB_BpoS-Papperlapapp]
MSNSRNKRTFEFDVTDAPMLLHAMSLAAATAMMCGHPDAKRRFQSYRDMLKEYVPVEADLFDEEVWGEMGMALARSQAFRVRIDLSPYHRGCQERGEYISRYLTKLRLYVEIDVGSKTKTFEAKYGVECEAQDDPKVKAVYDVLVNLAPMDCQGSCHDRFEFA